MAVLFVGAAARGLMVTGGFSKRIHLCRRLGVERGPWRTGRKRCGDE
jgi:hypothetical protein